MLVKSQNLRGYKGGNMIERGYAAQCIKLNSMTELFQLARSARRSVLG